MSKKVISLLVLSVLLISILPFVSSAFTHSHIASDIELFDTVNSPITQQCRPYLDFVLDGDTSTDLGVLHYGSNSKITSYIYPHTRGGYKTCLKEAGADVQMQCFCYGNALHIIEDNFYHTENGIVTKTLKKYLGTNYFGHMVVEKNAENMDMKELQKENPELYAEVMAYDARTLNSLFPELGGDSKFMTLTNQVAGIDMSNDARIFRSGYVGEGFYSTVYQDKVSLPFWAISIPLVLILLGLVYAGLMLKFGKTNWKWLAVLIAVILLAIAGVIIYSFLTGTTWKITTAIIEIPPRIGYLAVSQTDFTYANNLEHKAKQKFLETGELPYDDVSGLSYVDRNGNYVQGALNKAETGSFFLITLLLLISVILLLNLSFKSIVDKAKRNSTFKVINRILNYASIVLISALVIIVLYFVVRALFG